MGRILEFKTYKDFLKAERKVPWQYFIYRNQSVLMNSWMMRGHSTKINYKNLFGIDYKWRNMKIIDNYFFYHSLDLKRIQKVGKKISILKVNKAIEKCYKLGDEILTKSAKIKSKELSKLSVDELLDKLKFYKKIILLFHTFVIYPLYAYDIPFRKIVAKYLKDRRIKDVDDVMGILTYPIKKNFNYYEQYNFLKIVLKINKISVLREIFLEKSNKLIIEKLNYYPNILKAIEKHIKEYGWLQCRNYYGNEWSLKEVIERIKNVLSSAEDDFKNLKQLERKMSKDYKKLVKQLDIKDKTAEIIQLSKELVYYRTYRTDVLHKSGYNIRPLLSEIGKRFGYSFFDLIHMRIEEILDLPKRKISRKNIEERKKGFAMIMINGKMNWFWGKDFKGIGKELNKFKKSHKQSTEIKGNTANKGTAKGRVRIILTVDDLSKMRKNDILVAPMTFPSFIPAMEKASAFITNEGGILCHAAIVSREMNKPCIISTKIATQVLKDGDLVEVDANKGIVRILKKA